MNGYAAGCIKQDLRSYPSTAPWQPILTRFMPCYHSAGQSRKDEGRLDVFTGLVEALGRVARVSDEHDGRRFTIVWPELTGCSTL